MASIARQGQGQLSSPFAARPRASSFTDARLSVEDRAIHGGRLPGERELASPRPGLRVPSRGVRRSREQTEDAFCYGRVVIVGDDEAGAALRDDERVVSNIQATTGTAGHRLEEALGSLAGTSAR
jgi:hypothetical protein